MGVFHSFSNEILHQIVVFLVDEPRKQDYFDPIGIKDLQTARLLCRSMSQVATPFLFENMVLDEKFGEDEDVSRLLRFAEKNPTLAGFVRRLQRKIVPCVGSWSWIFNTSMATKLTRPFDAHCGVQHLCDLLLAPIRDSHQKDPGSWVCLEDSVVGDCLAPRYCVVCSTPLDGICCNSQTANYIL